jgi:hypothetical protein
MDSCKIANTSKIHKFPSYNKKEAVAVHSSQQQLVHDIDKTTWIPAK